MGARPPLSWTGQLDARTGRHHDASMRTTLTLDDDLLARLKDEAHRRRMSFRDVVNEALRRGLARAAPPRKAKVTLRSWDAKLRPGFDPHGFNRLADELEDEALVARLPARRA